MNETQTNFIAKVYNSAVSQEGGGEIKQFPILIIFTLIAEAIQLLMTFTNLFHNKTPAEIRENFKNLGIFDRLRLRRYVRQAINKQSLPVHEYAEFLQSGIKNGFAFSTDEEIQRAIKDFK
jgi:hypothetical protein